MLCLGVYLMREYNQLLLWIVFFYFLSWYSTWRSDATLIKVNKKFAKIFFYIKYVNGISPGSIIVGLFAHFCLILFLILIPLKDVVAPYMKLIVVICTWLFCCMLGMGLTIEGYINMKRAETVSKKRKWLIPTIFSFIGTGVLIYYFFIYVNVISNFI